MKSWKPIKANTGYDMESARPRCEKCTRMWNIDFIQLMAVQCPCFLVLNSKGWADVISNPVLPFSYERIPQDITHPFLFLPRANLCIPKIFKHDSSASNWNTRARLSSHSMISFPFDEACMDFRWFYVSHLHNVRGTSPDCLMDVELPHCVLVHISAKLHLSSQSPLWNWT